MRRNVPKRPLCLKPGLGLAKANVLQHMPVKLAEHAALPAELEGKAQPGDDPLAGTGMADFLCMNAVHFHPFL